MTHEEHRQRHVDLHEGFDELVADFLQQTPSLPSVTTLQELMRWSAAQAACPTRGDYDDRIHLPVIEVNRA